MENKNEIVELLCNNALKNEVVNVKINYIEEWILKTTCILVICASFNIDKISTIFVNKSLCADKVLQDRINNHLTWIRKYNGASIKIKA